MLFKTILSALACSSLVQAIALPQGLGTLAEKPSTSQTLLDTIDEFQASSGQRFAFLKSLIASARGQIDGIVVPENYQLSIFVPSDQAFSSISLELLMSSEKVHALVSYHVIPSTVNITTVPVDAHQAFKTLAGEDVLIGTNGTTKASDVLSRLNSKANIIGSITVGKLVAIFVDNILQPPSPLADTARALRLTNFVSLLKEYKPRPSVAKISDYTIFIPNEQAISAFLSSTCKTADNFKPEALEAVLDNHIYPGSRVYANTFATIKQTGLQMASNQTIGVTPGATLKVGTATVTGPQYLVEGGVAHLIDSVLVPSGLTSPCKSA